MEKVKGTVTQKMEKVKGTVMQKMEKVKGTVMQKMEKVKGTVMQKMEKVKGIVMQKMEADIGSKETPQKRARATCWHISIIALSSCCTAAATVAFSMRQSKAEL